MNSNNYEVALNLLALKNQVFTFTVYRRLVNVNEKEIYRDFYQVTLPIQADDKDTREKYWISFSQIDGFDSYNCYANDNHYLTKYFLYYQVKNQLENLVDGTQYYVNSNRFERVIYFVIKEHSEGNEVIRLEPYYLSAKKEFGFLIEFEFHKKKDAPFNRVIQKLSLSLDVNYKSNKNFYIDKFKKIESFLNKSSILQTIFPITSNVHPEIDIENNLSLLQSETLNSKTYVFGNNEPGDSTFQGISKNEPFEILTNNTHFFFAFADEARDYALDFYKALRGQQYSTTFPGLYRMFKVSIEKDNTSRSTVKSFDTASVKQMIAEIKAGNHNSVIQIAILNSREGKQDYYNLKHSFLSENIPLQIVTLDLLRNKEAFKWSVSNIALQMFAKLGGKPWKVKPSNQNCLIIGVGQSHKLTKTSEGRTIVDKYFAYSVLIDSSGLYKDIEILGNSENEENYAKQIQTKIEEIVRKYKGEYRSFVIHTPFKLKNKELYTIQKALEKLSVNEDFGGIELVVIKINTKNKFFGYHNQANSLVPYESTYLQISFQEFLIWFEGIHPSRPNIYKRFSGPTHIQFYYSNKQLSYPEKIKYLQDIINLSGANWRGFNAKLLPVSIYYCQLIARRIKELRSLGYSDIQIKDSNPWFL
jgi:Piwi domain